MMIRFCFNIFISLFCLPGIALGAVPSCKTDEICVGSPIQDDAIKGSSKDAITSSPDKSSTDVLESEHLGEVFFLRLADTINPATADFLIKSIVEAEEKKAAALVIELNTPGGLLTSMQAIVERLLDSKVPVVVYVGPSGGGAISAGVFIAMAGHVAVMAPGTTIGAAHPVSGGGENLENDMRDKAENFAASMAKAIAEQRGRNAAWAEKAVRESVTLTDREAVKEKVVDFVAADLSTVLKQLEGREIKLKDPERTVKLVDLSARVIRTLEMGIQQQIISAISDPNIMALLGLGAMGGLMAEFYNPGLIFPGLFGAICLILSLVAAQIIPINAGGVLLLILGMGLITLEAFIPSFGILGISGIVALVLGAIYTVDAGSVWASEGVFAIDDWFIGSIAAFLGFFVLLLGLFVAKTRSTKVTTGALGMIGKTAEITRSFLPSDSLKMVLEGKVQVMGEIWDASYVLQESEQDQETITKLCEEVFSPGREVEIVELHGLKLIIRPLK